jgi:hypothetical protein
MGEGEGVELKKVLSTSNYRLLGSSYIMQKGGMLHAICEEGMAGRSRAGLARRLGTAKPTQSSRFCIPDLNLQKSGEVTVALEF